MEGIDWEGDGVLQCRDKCVGVCVCVCVCECVCVCVCVWHLLCLGTPLHAGDPPSCVPTLRLCFVYVCPLGRVQSNTKVEMFKLDDTLPPEMFAQLCRIGSGVSARGIGKGGVRVGAWSLRSSPPPLHLTLSPRATVEARNAGPPSCGCCGPTPTLRAPPPRPRLPRRRRARRARRRARRSRGVLG